MNSFGAYIHVKPDGTPFYVGKGRIDRAKRLDASHHNPYHARVVSKYGRQNIAIAFIPCSTEQIAFDLEIGLIKCFKRSGHALSNITSGGEGVSGPKSKEHLAKISAALKGRTGTFTGKKHTPETLAKLKAASTGKFYRRGKKCSVETVEKMRIAAVKQWSNPKNIETQRNAAKKQMKPVVACGVTFESRHSFSSFTGVPLTCVSRWANRGWQDKIDAAYTEAKNAGK